jgi:hypothetical protein
MSRLAFAVELVGAEHVAPGKNTWRSDHIHSRECMAASSSVRLSEAASALPHIFAGYSMHSTNK